MKICKNTQKYIKHVEIKTYDNKVSALVLLNFLSVRLLFVYLGIIYLVSFSIMLEARIVVPASSIIENETKYIIPK